MTYSRNTKRKIRTLKVRSYARCRKELDSKHREPFCIFLSSWIHTHKHTHSHSHTHTGLSKYSRVLSYLWCYGIFLLEPKAWIKKKKYKIFVATCSTVNALNIYFQFSTQISIFNKCSHFIRSLKKNPKKQPPQKTNQPTNIH